MPHYVDYQCPQCRRPLERDQVCPECNICSVDSHTKLQCPNCGALNRLNRTLCLQCSTSFVDENGDYLPIDKLGTALPSSPPDKPPANQTHTGGSPCPPFRLGSARDSPRASSPSLFP
jgi:hypothetical protein